MQLAVLAGGYGKRLQGAIPEGLPKPLAPIAGKPFLEHLFDRAIGRGVTDIHLLVGYGAHLIRDHFGDYYCGVALTYHVEETPLGTGGALKSAMPKLQKKFILANGDTFADADYPALLALLDSSPLSMSLSRIDDVSRYGSVVTSATEITGFQEKGAAGPGLINAGVYACSQALLGLLPERDSFSFEVDFLEPHLPRLRPRFIIVASKIIDIGTPESYSFANSTLGDSGNHPKRSARDG